MSMTEEELGEAFWKLLKKQGFSEVKRSVKKLSKPNRKTMFAGLKNVVDSLEYSQKRLDVVVSIICDSQGRRQRRVCRLLSEVSEILCVLKDRIEELKSMAINQ